MVILPSSIIPKLYPSNQAIHFSIPHAFSFHILCQNQFHPSRRKLYKFLWIPHLGISSSPLSAFRLLPDVPYYIGSYPHPRPAHTRFLKLRVKYFESCPNPCLPFKIHTVDTKIHYKNIAWYLALPCTCFLGMPTCVSDLTPSLLFKNDLQPTGTALSHTQTHSTFPSKC